MPLEMLHHIKMEKSSVSCIYHVLKVIYDTSDVQAVNATVVDESTIDIQCWFIHGSDALGCKVVLVSDYPGVNIEIINISRNNTLLAFGRINLTQPVSCYSKVVAFDIESDDTLSNLTIEVQLRATPNTLCSG